MTTKEIKILYPKAWTLYKKDCALIVNERTAFEKFFGWHDITLGQDINGIEKAFKKLEKRL